MWSGHGEVWSWVKRKHNDLPLCSFILMPPQLPERHKVAEAGLGRPVGVRKMTQRWGAGRESPGLGWQDTALDGGSGGLVPDLLCVQSISKPRTRHTLLICEMGRRI